MEGTSMLGNSSLPPGFRFHPTDEELITHYLKQKVLYSSPSSVVSLIADVDLYKFDPWDLPGKALFGEAEWFFFSPRDRKYPNGDRPNRAAGSGYWKATGTDKPILSTCSTSGSQCLGVKKALVFYTGKPSKGAKTDWLMDEYRLLDHATRSPKCKGSMRLDDWVLCRVRRKSSTTISYTSQMGDKHESSCSVSPESLVVQQYLEEQTRKKRNELFEGCEHQLLAYLMGSPEGGSSPVLDSCVHQNISLHQESTCNITPNLPDSEMASHHQQSHQAPPAMVSSFQNMLESIKRSLSIGALDEHWSVLPNKRLAASCDNHKMDDMIISTNMEELSPTVSTSSVPRDECFSSYHFA